MLLKSAKEFVFSLDKNVQTKIFFTLDKASFINDPKLFKKLQDEIWEFRVKYKGLQIRLLSFWDKRDNKNTLVVSTHGFVKKTGRVPKGEIDNAIAAMKQYFESQ